MRLDRLPQFLSRLPIRDKEGGIVPFHPNYCQQLILAKLRERQAQHKPLWFLLLKSRQIGGSTLMIGTFIAHCIAQANARAMIVAHKAASAKELFDRARLMWDAVDMRQRPDPTQRMLTFLHEADQHSTIRQATAGSTASGRGMTLSALLLSEAAHFQGADSFIAFLPTVPYNEHTIVCCETTANGKEGPGKSFYEFWTAAEQGRNDFLPIFIGCQDDPECRRDPKEMEGHALDNDEKDLRKRFETQMDAKSFMAFLAWRRWAIETKAQGYVDKFNQEFPYSADVAFIASGDPAFSSEEIRLAEASCRPPAAQGRLEQISPGVYDIVPLGAGRAALRIWERPQEDHEYTCGADAAKGTETGDFSAAVVWDATTGHQVATFADRVSAAPFADLLNRLGRWYNRAMMNIELTGGYGTHVQQVLRDEFLYPRFYIWKGKNDKLGQQRRIAIGWETTFYSRERMFTAFREAIKMDILQIRDKVMVEQMKTAIRCDGRVEIEAEHDDILFAGLIGWIARVDWPPVGRARMALPSAASEAQMQGGTQSAIAPRFLPEDPFKEHADFVQRMLDGRAPKPDPLAGV